MPSDDPREEPTESDRIDPYLQMLLGCRLAAMEAENKESDMSITLLCGGTAVCGKIVSNQAYFRGVAEGLADKVESPKTKVDILTTFDLRRLAQKIGLEVPEPDPSKLPRYIHLKNALAWLPQGPVSFSWWRCKISSVDGWNWGHLKLQETPQG